MEAVSAGKDPGPWGVAPGGGSVCRCFRGPDRAWRCSWPVCADRGPRGEQGDAGPGLRLGAAARSSVVGADFGKRDRVRVQRRGHGRRKSADQPPGSFRASFTVPGADRRPVEDRLAQRRPAHRELLSRLRRVERRGEVASRRGRRVRWTPGTRRGRKRPCASRARASAPAAASGSGSAAVQVATAPRRSQRQVLDGADGSVPRRRPPFLRVKLATGRWVSSSGSCRRRHRSGPPDGSARTGGTRAKLLRARPTSTPDTGVDR